MNLTHFLFGSVLAVDRETMGYIIGVTSISLLTMTAIYPHHHPVVRCGVPNRLKL